jgi:hypothetical protein
MPAQQAVTRPPRAIARVAVMTIFPIPDPARYDGLASYLDAHAEKDAMAPVAVNVLHNAAVEPAFDPMRPVLGQRRFVKFAPDMCKPLIKRVPQPWLMGFHRIRSRFEIDPDLLLVHLKYYDSDALGLVAEARRHSYDNERRGAAASDWSLGGTESRRLLGGWVRCAELDQVREFDPCDLDLTGVVVQKENGFFHSTGPPLEAMEAGPLMMLPDRFRSVV